MSTEISWTDEVWNPIIGCTKVSEGCRHCYAEGFARRLASNPQTTQYQGIADTKGWTGITAIVYDALAKPLSWKKPRRVFVNSMGDLLHPDVPDEWVMAVVGVMAATTRHSYQVLTKRPERMAQFTNGVELRDCVVKARSYGIDIGWPLDGVGGFPLPNVWLGASVEDQETADVRLPLLGGCIGWKHRFVSFEPALGQVDVSHYLGFINWVIVGGESGPGARPCDVRWVRSIVEQCADAGAPCFVKQLGARPVDGGTPLNLRSRAGRDMAEWPADLRVQQFPEAMKRDR